MIWLVMRGQRIPYSSGGDTVDEDIWRACRYGRWVKAFMVGTYVPNLSGMLGHVVSTLLKWRAHYLIHEKN